ncbi:MAG: NFACT family protein [Candidatus Woesearchaeota archaeon]|nr:NFACT family protein [Candidatus Woesearchaeota archaeon]
MEKSDKPCFLKKLSSFELSLLLSELKFLEGARLQKVYQPEERQFFLQFYVPSKGKSILRAVFPSLLFIGQEKPDSLKNPSRMVSLLRKYLENSQLSSISQIGFERIVKLSFTIKSESYSLLIELFSKGNLILCKEEDGKSIILGLLESQSWKDRILKQGEEYKLPPSLISPFSLKSDEFNALISGSDREVVKFLAIEFGFGGLYSEELCLISGVLKSKISSSLSTGEKEALFSAISSIQKRKLCASSVYKKDSDELVDVVPVELLFYKDFRKVPYESFSSALDSSFGNIELSSFSEQGRASISEDKEMKKIQRLIEEQGLSAARLESEYCENQKKAESVYNHYSEIKEVFDFLKEELSHSSVSEAFEKLKTFKSVKGFDKKERKLTMGFED